ncbi:nucleotidyltransferase domain-containing protein [Leucothrix pacifica]|uniref:Nucleotidyltransferase family protein n=1 Tax=Leucothrix pacifica TaxID=1247513 RepID=A0A317C2P2_9GAMM|nr:nucleotidyltransferase family protein [Leucothrix pacifica]PWQ92599.1 hypothetical protein DKW60_20345 [Leucothrix pacifica]
MFNRGKTINAEQATTKTSKQHFRKLCQLCSPNFSKEAVLADEIDWPTVWTLALRHRVVPVMADRIKQLGIIVPEDISSRISNNVQKNLYKGMKQAAELVCLTKLFNENNIPFVVFKGIALLKLMGLELHQRHHGDIDILLADVGDIKKADVLLRSLGYERLTMAKNFSLNKRQEQHFRSYEKDVIYHHPRRSIQLELHFKVCLSDKLLPISSREFYENRAEVQINSESIPVMCKADHQVYLLVHGAVSRWFRLKWLCDVPLATENGKAYLSSSFFIRTESLDVERITTLGICLARELLAMPIVSNLSQYGDNSKSIQWIKGVAQKNITEVTIYDMSLLEKIRFWMVFSLIYMPLLKEDRAYKLDHFKSYLTRMSDWETLPLPSSLFFLYYPLRPFLWLKRQF